MVLKRLRESRNLTQQQFADLLGVTRSAVAMWETGESLPRTDKLVKIAEVLGCSVEELLVGA